MLVQAAFRQGSLAEACAWQTVVIITKGYGKYFRLIVMVEFLWKSTTSIINCQLTSEIRYHDTLHGFWTGHGKGTATLEDKLTQHLTVMGDTVLHTVFLYLLKLYDALYWYRCLDVLVGYSVGTITLRILQT